MAGPTVELGIALLQCFATPVGVGSAVLRSNVLTPFTVVELLIPFCDEL